MTTFNGVGVSPGRVVGRVRQMPPAVSEPPAGLPLAEGTTPEQAVAQLKTAAAAVQSALRERASGASGDAKAVLEATALMAADPMLIKAATKQIESGAAAERALWEAAEGVASMLLQLGGYMAERSRDVYDVRARIVAELRGVPAPGIPDSDEPFILLAEDLAPADTATLDPRKVLALVTADGGPQSHTAIIARALGLPAVVAAPGVRAIPDETEVYVDGTAGSLSTDVGPAELSAAQDWTAQASRLSSFEGQGALSDGTPVPLLANVGNAAEAAAAAQAGADGVGLFRTEFLFLDREAEPSAEEQTAAYRGVFDAFPGKKVVVRTLDAGADKPLPFLSSSDEPNPALGVRGYRTDHYRREPAVPGVLARQLSAIAAAAAVGTTEVWVMAPMVATPVEAARFGRLSQDAGLKTTGVMIEVPSAALSTRHIMKHVDFASLGTNDLTQYTMAADRQLGPLAELNDPWQPAVLSLIAVACNAAQQSAVGQSTEKPVGVCGEAAADPALAVVLVGLGVHTLSMTARAIPAVAAVLQTVSLEQARQIAAEALQQECAAAARASARAKLPVLEELGL
ncbi:phosphoenolpyruvate--protein phosphotransferase [Arthrobacter russicus]|uniref:Phosphoenolpyruvate-protein phosphotransferase n=1 Tax=Arthrobacter russicus TaxID=172040 RepID=A0ABU1JDP0_9MICC|nr:phosphoenolpyruvate--protein phosphotransferase [Arthrobacter russicus]MDR6269556.1 phosphotransferase system enzyme I (PtsI) [Arthrobacter russicus]